MNDSSVLARRLEPAAAGRAAGGFAWSRSVLGLPLVFTLALAALAFRADPTEGRVREAAWGAAALLLLWNTGLALDVVRRRRMLAVEVTPRKQHYLQACAQGTVLLYWGYYWREVYGAVDLIAGQLLFAYAFDMLLAWSRRDTHTLGFAPFPVIFSINLFLWFKAEWFYLQFLLVAVGLAAKELIRWEKEGRRVHVFNPSSFPLGLFSLALILTGTTDMTWGQEIATTLNNAPSIYLLIFLVALPGQFLFGVTTMTMSAVVAMYVFGLLYFSATGTYYFIDSYIPIAVFLGMHLLFTDPSTAPRTDLGRILFGVLYAASVVALYDVLGRLGAPTFYDKLLAVPLMNVTIKAIDRLASGPLRRFDPAALTRPWVGRRSHLAYIGVWSVVFVALSSVQAVGDTHRGQRVMFWLKACEENRPNGCRQAGVLTSAYCRSGSGWACNEYGILVQPALRPEVAARAFQRACDLGFAAGCGNLDAAAGASPRHAAPELTDYRVLLRGRKGPLPDLTPQQLRQRACEQEFVVACGTARFSRVF